jgi:hypothetical protein
LQVEGDHGFSGTERRVDAFEVFTADRAAQGLVSIMFMRLKLADWRGGLEWMIPASLR